MKVPGDLWRITCTDFIVRTSYQVGKTPLMPLFAASLGAGELFIGLIVSVSTLTGMLLKPIFGWLSDQWGRTIWLFFGLTFFSGAPFLYVLVDTPAELFSLRLVHGFATAMFGPVSLAFVAELSQEGRAERLGWFGMARTGGYLIAPLLSAWLLTWLEPSTVFTVIGFTSCIAFVPFCMMDRWRSPHCDQPNNNMQRMSRLKETMRTVVANTTVWLVGGLELAVYFVLYATKAFLPIYALHMAGFDLLTVGLFFTVQETSHIVTRPFGGFCGDRVGYLKIVNVGYIVFAIGLAFLPYAASFSGLLTVAVVIGLAQGLIFPSTVALVSRCIEAEHLGTGLGMLGALRNFGKIVGPVSTGVLLTRFDYSLVFNLCALGLLVVVISLYLVQRYYGGETYPRCQNHEFI